jgi:hypothetical protein
MNLRNNLMRWLSLGLAVVAFAATAAQAGTRPARDTSDVVSRYLGSHATPDVFERYAAAHPYGVGLAATPIAAPAGFRWEDYGAGVGTGIALVLLLAGGVVATPIWRRQRRQPAIG